MSILIVDDRVDNCLLIESMLKHGGYKDLIALYSSKDVIHLLKSETTSPNDSKQKIELIIMDLYLPEMNGIEACRQIKSMEQYKDLPIIIVSVNTEMENLEASFEAGAIDFIPMPLNRIELLARVRSVLKLKLEMDQRKAREEELLYIHEQLKKSNEVLQQHAIIDGLTGVFNRRNFDEMLKREWQRALRKSFPISLILLDVDYFKGYNDTYGHQMGDECLRKIAAALAKALKRPGDLIARYGGEEFSVILPETDANGALTVANNMQAGMENLNIPYPKSKVSDQVTISMGVATTIPDYLKSFTIVSSKFAQLKSFIESADRALYFAKDSGRNQIKFADDLKLSIIEV